MPLALQVRRAAGAAAAGAERLPHRPGRLRQILHLLRRPLYARRRDLAGRSRRSSTRRKALVDAGAKEITLLGQNVNAWRGRRRPRPRRPDPRARRAAGPRAHPLHDQPSERHDRGPDPRPCRGREADALPASAGAVGQRPRAQGDEPQPQRASPISRIIDRVRAARPDIAHLGRFHRRLPRRDRRRVRGDAEDRRGGELRPGFLVQIFAAARHARRGHGGSDSAPK